ncbi:MAG: ABC transporter substrate-binding protein [Chloroflexi bacterium]|nr:ABC transporter substrate-binding protein [Chloroflexota bacterium]
MLRKALIALLAVGLLATSACSGAAPAQTKPAETTKSTEASKTTEAAKPAEAKPAESKPAAAAPAKPKVVGIVQLVAHPALDLTRKGLIDALAEAGFKDGDKIKIDLQNAQGQVAATKTIADKFVADNVDLIISITTPAGQSAAKATQGTKIPLVFVGVSDAVGAGLIKSIGQPTGTNLTGIYNFDPIPAQMDLAAEILPNLKTLGVIYNAGESNSVSNVDRLKKDVAKRGWKVVDATVASSSDVLSSARSLVGRVDAIYMPQDNTVVSALEALIKTANEAKLPLFVGDIESVKRGAIATLGNDQYETGKQAGVMAARVLKGEEPGKIVPEEVKVKSLAVNVKAAEAIGLKIPDSVVKRAQEVIK